MIQYILESIAFQLLFLVVYDFYLKKETFFQWNRLYLLGTFVFSLVLPWVKIEAFKQQVPQTFAPYPEYLWKLQNEAVVAKVQESSGWNITWQEGILYGGMLVALLLFGLKIRQLYLLRRSGEKVTYPSFTQIIITNSNIAFSWRYQSGAAGILMGYMSHLSNNIHIEYNDGQTTSEAAVGQKITSASHFTLGGGYATA